MTVYKQDFLKLFLKKDPAVLSKNNCQNNQLKIFDQTIFDLDRQLITKLVINSKAKKIVFFPIAEIQEFVT